MTSKAVNRPTDPAKRDADINRKLQFYGIFQGRELHPITAESVSGAIETRLTR